MFVGQTIRAVIYGELKYYADEEDENTNAEPYYQTKYADIDTLDYSIYFKTDDGKAIYVFWDNTFISYGLQSEQLDFTENTNDYEQKWDVSTNNKWVDYIGQKIVDFKIIWEKTWSSNLYGTIKVYTKYPQTFEITTENGKSIFITAADLNDGKDEFCSQMDNLLVTTNLDLLKKLGANERQQIEIYKSKKSFWTKIFGH